MKIEKLSDTQIRCTLDKQDLAERELRLSELAYGSEKAKELFRDLMLQATYECGFEAEDIPLMIEAIPVNPDCLVLVITKVEDPDELDTRFSNFTPFRERNEEIAERPAKPALADEILNCVSQLGKMLGSVTEQAAKDEEEEIPEAALLPENFAKVYSFPDLKSLTSLAAIAASIYHGDNSLYHDAAHGAYYLVLGISGHSPEEFNKICNIVSEYGRAEQTDSLSLSYYSEHYRMILPQNALSVLADIA